MHRQNVALQVELPREALATPTGAGQLLLRPQVDMQLVEMQVAVVLEALLALVALQLDCGNRISQKWG